MATDHKRSTKAEERRRRNPERDGVSRRMPLGTRIGARFAEAGLDDDLQELRGAPARPATFEK